MENSGFSLLLLLCTKWMRGNVHGLGEKTAIFTGVIKMTAVPLWLIENVRLPDREGLWQIAIDKGCFGDITPMGDARSESYEVLNARGGLAIPPFIEPHIHLDTTQTAGEPNWNQSGTLFEGIERWAERKALLSHEDVKARAWKTLKWQIGNGIQFVRTHVDVSDPTPMVRPCWRRPCDSGPMWSAPFRTLSLLASMAWNRCISRSVWRSSISVRWIFTAMRLTTSSRGLSKRWRLWR